MTSVEKVHRGLRAHAFTLSCLWPQSKSFCVGQEAPNALAKSLWKHSRTHKKKTLAFSGI